MLSQGESQFPVSRFQFPEEIPRGRNATNRY
jgi:hypothetical protein